MRVWAPLRVAVLLAALLVLSGHAAFGAPQVLYDSGLTWPLAPYLAIFDEDWVNEEGVDEDRSAESPASPPATASGVTLDALLPIRTPEMSPGAVRARGPQAAATGARPVFLIGTDPLSLEWLAAHRARLIELGAVGMLIEADSVEAVRQVATRAEGLKILPASGAELARALGVRHYPVLISARGIEQ
jgi:integrating conjugative element protein (TIGR03765 family)